MKTVEARVSPNMKVVMQEDDKVLDEVVVTGYGVTRRATFTGSASTLSNKVVTDVTVTSMDKALQGNAPGLLTQASSGQPGAGQRIVIRGIGSIMAGTEPLWIIDGVPVATGNFGQLTNTGETTYSDNSNALAGINPNDIANITVLKDASATSIYGARAANGVVLVTTKSGSEGKTKFNVSASYGWSSRAVNKFKVMDKDQYLEYMSEALYNSGGYASTDEAIDDLYDTFPLQSNGEFYNFNWLKEAYHTSPTYSFDASASGGNAKTKFYTSVGYFNQEGILESSSMDRISNKINVVHNYSDNFRFGVNSTLSFTKQDTPLTTSSYYANPVLQAAIQPNIDPAFIDGEIRQRTTILSTNYYGNVAYNYAKQRIFRVVESAYAEYDIISGLTLKTQWGVDFMQVNESQWDDPRVGGNTAMNTKGRGTRTSGESLVWNNTNTLSYNKTFNEVHNLDAMVGLEFFSDTYRYNYAQAEQFPTSEFQELTSGSTPVATESSHDNVKLASVLSRVNYAYDNKYILSASLRRDGSSRFSEDNRYANFWSVGGQWRISREDFMASTTDWLSNLGLRASYGTTGNADIKNETGIDGRYPYMGLYRAGYNYDGYPGIAPYQVVNDNLKWESSAAFNVGVDAAFFNNRLNTTIEFYNKKTNDLLQRVPLSRTTGFLQTIKNVGSMQNRGIELTITGVPVVTKDFEWTVSFNISHNKNKVLELYNKQDIVTGTRITREGEDIQSIYTYEWAGVDPEDGAPMWYAEDGSKVKQISKANRRIVGSAAPKYFGGLTNTFKYKGFDVSALIYFNQGNKITDQTLAMINADGARGLFNQSVDLLDRWQKPGDVTDVPKAMYGASSATYAPMSTRYVYDGSFIRLRNLNIGYTLPDSVLPGMRIYFQGTNLFTITDYKGLDPEVGIAGDPWFGYPVSKTITFGFNYNF